jgi:hypothetical protein
MYVGTNHFNSLKAAVAFYEPYGYDLDDISSKINNNEIKIGKPEGSDEELRLNSEGRWERLYV